jgi:hypothetical protein
MVRLIALTPIQITIVGWWAERVASVRDWPRLRAREPCGDRRNAAKRLKRLPGVQLVPVATTVR